VEAEEEVVLILELGEAVEYSISVEEEVVELESEVKLFH
jgi:hypothetical protein